MIFPLLSIENWAVYTPNSKLFANHDCCGVLPIPASFKRRCSNIDKRALEVANRAIGNRSIDHAVFCSQHGELSRTVNLLKDICNRTILSPMDFSQSVHNTVAGLFSVMHNLHQDIVTIAAGNHTFLMGMIEAFAWMQLNPGKTVLFVMFDYHIPEEYTALNVRDIPNESRILGLAQIDPSSLEFTRGGEERVTGAYKDIRDCRERRYQQSVKPKCEGYSGEYAMAFLLTDAHEKAAAISLSVQTCTNDETKAAAAQTATGIALEFLEWFMQAETTELIQNNDNKIFRWCKVHAQKAQ